MGSDEEANAALSSTLGVMQKYGNRSEHQANYAIAKNVADEEMGRYGEYPRNYSLSEQTKDTLLAHGRQDSAHALCNTKSIMDQNAAIAWRLKTLNFLALIIVALLCAIVAKLYPQLLQRLL